MGWIQTASGKKFDLVNPTVDMVNLPDIAHSLAHQCRFTGHTHVPYSVARHSLLVADLVPPELRLEALLHDAHEAYIGDLSTPLKWTVPEFRAVNDRVWNVVADAFGINRDLHWQVKHADRVMLLTERRDLLTYCPDQWDPEFETIQPRARQISFHDTRGFGRADARDFSAAVSAELLKRRAAA